MTSHTLTPPSTEQDPETATKRRVGLLAIALAVTSVIAPIAGLFWPSPSGSGHTYTYADIAGQRDLWWGLLTLASAVAIVTVLLQSVAAMLLVRRRGSTWATIGGALMWLGVVLQGVGVAGWATAYFFPTDPSLDPAAGKAAFAVVNDNIGHIFGVMLAGTLLVIIGQVLQSVGLLRAKVVPTWVAVAYLFIILTIPISGNGLIGLIPEVPMSAAGIALGYYAWRRV